MSNKSRLLFTRRKSRNRFSIKKKSSLSHRLVVFRSNANMYAQLIDDNKGNTLLTVSTLNKDVKKSISNNNGGNIKAASVIGDIIAKKALDKGIKEVFFDRGGYIYHGRVKALAESARKTGLKF